MNVKGPGQAQETKETEGGNGGSKTDKVSMDRTVERVFMRKLTNELIDVNEGEKEVLNAWNDVVMGFKSVGLSDIPRIVEKFMSEKSELLGRLPRNCTIHLCALEQAGLITPQQVLKSVTAVRRAAAARVSAGAEEVAGPESDAVTTSRRSQRKMMKSQFLMRRTSVPVKSRPQDAETSAAKRRRTVTVLTNVKSSGLVQPPDLVDNVETEQCNQHSINSRSREGKMEVEEVKSLVETEAKMKFGTVSDATSDQDYTLTDENGNIEEVIVISSDESEAEHDQIGNTEEVIVIASDESDSDIACDLDFHSLDDLMHQADVLLKSCKSLLD